MNLTHIIPVRLIHAIHVVIVVNASIWAALDLVRWCLSGLTVFVLVLWKWHQPLYPLPVISEGTRQLTSIVAHVLHGTRK